MEPNDLAAFAAAIEKLKAAPALIHKPEVGFFKDLLISLGVPLPAVAEADLPSEAPVQVELLDSDAEDVSLAAVTAAEKSRPAESAESVHIADSDDDDPGRLPEDEEPFLPIVKPTEGEPSEAQQEACSQAKMVAMKALEDGDVPRALEHYTEAILTGVAGALVYTKRGELLLRQQRPRAAIRDCSVAIEVNPDCGRAYRIRGMAHRRLGMWEAAHHDLSLGQKLDYEEDITEVQKFVSEKLRKLEARRAKAAAEPPRKRRRVA